MSTDISVKRKTHPSNSRAWLLSSHGTEPGTNPSITLDLALFPNELRVNGVVPSGTVVGKITATDLYGPYDSTASDGRQTARGLMFDYARTDGATKVGGALVVHGFVNAARLPFSTGAGALSAPARAALAMIHFEN